MSTLLGVLSALALSAALLWHLKAKTANSRNTVRAVVGAILLGGLAWWVYSSYQDYEAKPGRVASTTQNASGTPVYRGTTFHLKKGERSRVIRLVPDAGVCVNPVLGGSYDLFYRTYDSDTWVTMQPGTRADNMKEIYVVAKSEIDFSYWPCAKKPL